jgi:hypothetical protein
MLTGPRQRIDRANRQIVALQRSFQGFFRDHLYKVGVAEYNRKADHYSLRVLAGPEEFPVDWSLCIGEIAHNLRSALDGLAWQIGRPTTESAEDRTYFPVCLKRQTGIAKGGVPIYAFGKGGAAARKLANVPKTFWTKIESFQPYKRGNGGRRNSLFRLEELNNADKHRLLTVLTPGAASWEFSGLSGGTHFNRRAELHMGAKIGWVRDVPPNIPGQGGIYALDLSDWKPGRGLMEGVKLVEPKMEVNINVGPYVRFGDTCKAVERLPVIATLQRIANEVSRVVESFA